MAGLPPLPQINETDLVLAVYTHESLQSGATDEHLGDPKRLAYLGKNILYQVLSYHYFMKKPTLTQEDIETQIQHNHPDFVELLHSYGLRGKIRCDPSWAQAIDSPEVAENFFHKYIGALFLQHGVATVQDWISQLVDPGIPTPLLPAAAAAANVRQSQPSFQSQPPPPSHPAPPPPPYPTSHSSAPAPPQPIPLSNNNNYQILAQFNMTAHQRGYSVTYPARSEGPHHTPIWHVQCRLNDEVRGEGTGKNQKQAKEMAARQAWVSMGWGQLPD